VIFVREMSDPIGIIAKKTLKGAQRATLASFARI
jgi:hypothetical protein